MALKPPEADARPRRLIVNADDFGRSAAVNQAVVRAHREGILTAASLMVNEAGFDEAVALARKHPTLGVGLHLTLACGHAALPPEVIPGLVNANGELRCGLVSTGFRYFFRSNLRDQLRQEIHAQFQKFHAAHLPLDHVNGHLHLHLHPTVFSILMADAAQLGLKRLRLTFDPLRLNLRLASGHFAYRALHAAMFHPIAARARLALASRGIQHTDAVFGLLQNARVDETYTTRLLPHLPAGDSELYCHPSLDESRHEFEALISPRVRDQIRQLGIQLIRYQDL